MYTGILIAILAGICLGTCFLPMRYMKGFAWENTWFVWSFTGLVVLPPLIAFVTVPNLFQIFREVGWNTTATVLAIGLVAGTSGIFLGRGLAIAGMTIANSVMNGVSLVVGSFVPLIKNHPEALSGQIGLTLLGGLLLAVTGVIFCSVAGSQRTTDSAYEARAEGSKRSGRALAMFGVLLCVIAGLLTPLQNIGLDYASRMTEIARSHGAPEAFKSFIYFIPYLGTSFVSNGIFFAVLWRRNGTLKEFRQPQARRYVGLAILMAAVWMLGIILYGWAMPWVGSFGPVIVWPMMLVTTSIASAVTEYLYGDWKGRALRTLGIGLTALSLSIVMFAYSNHVIQQTSIAN
jgi:L-rhamnose-H+ transport protein